MRSLAPAGPWIASLARTCCRGWRAVGLAVCLPLGLPLGLAACLTLGLAACGGGAAAPVSPAPAAATPATPAAPATPAPPAKATFPGTPATPSGDQLAWVLDAIIKRQGKIERAELEAHFHPTFLATVPVEQARKIFEQMSPQLADLAIVDVQAEADQLLARVTASGTKLRISLVLDPASKQIAGLLIQRDEDLGPRPQSFGAALRAAAELAPRAQLLVAELSNGTCRPLQELAARDPLAIGSTFKLYVLLALADRILAGKARWTDEIAVREEWKSVPAGVTQNDPPGTRQSLATLAERMIAISDNTAADHLLYTLGRRAVEAAMRSTRHARPALNTPFPSTREISVLKLALPAAEVERYLKLPEAARRDYLDRTLAARPPGLDLTASWTTARRIDKLEWFASAEDLCRVMAALWTRAQDPRAARVLDILAKGSGMPIDPKVWPYAGFKGGSEPGVLNVTHLLRRDDGKWFVVTLGFNAAEGGTLEQAKIFHLVGGVLELAGKAR
jgi:beta-lactamase class A